MSNFNSFEIETNNINIDLEETSGLLSHPNTNIDYKSIDINMNTNHVNINNISYPRLYEFIPTAKYPKVRIYTEKSLDSALKAIIRLDALILVISDAGGDLDIGRCIGSENVIKNSVHMGNEVNRELGNGNANGNGSRDSEEVGWYYIYCSGQEGWTHIPDGFNNYIAHNSSANDNSGTAANENGIFHVKENYKRYEDFKGNNYFLWGGTLMFGADLYTFYFCNFSILTPSLCLLIFVCPQVELGFISPALCIIGFLVLLAYCMVNLWYTALTEPGILPKNPPHIKVQYCAVC